MSFSVPGSHPGYHITYSYHVSLDFSWLWQFLRLSLFLMTLTVLRSTGRVYCRMALPWNLPAVFLMIRLGLWVLGKKTTELECHFCHIISRIHTTFDYFFFLIEVHKYKYHPQLITFNMLFQIYYFSALQRYSLAVLQQLLVVWCMLSIYQHTMNGNSGFPTGR